MRVASGTPRPWYDGWPKLRRPTLVRREPGGWPVAGKRESSRPTPPSSSRAQTEVMILDPVASHQDGPIFLNVLRVLDTPAALGLLAPRRLTLISTWGDAWSLTKTLYERAGHPISSPVKLPPENDKPFVRKT